MLENDYLLEGIEMTDQPEFEGKTFSSLEMDYISEMKDSPSDLVDRIDEFNTDIPPKAIDSNKEINELISPVKDTIDPIYLEAPSDSIQVEQISDSMKDVGGLNFEEWKGSLLDDRKEILQEAEVRISEIEHRPACELIYEKMGEGEFGYFDKERGVIALNETYIESDSFSDYKETLDTLIHEGRHAYQDYNIKERQVHSSPGDITNWRMNEFDVGYQDVNTYGFHRYWMQPVEADARKFAEDVLTKFMR